jgi:hypothetical protein
VVDRLVDLVDGRLEAPRRQVVVLRERALEGLQLAFEVGDVDVLRLHQRQLGLVLQRVHRRVAQQRDDGQEELRPHHVHLGVAVEHVDDAGVVELAVGLQQRDQHRVLAALLAAVLVELLQEVLVAVLGGGAIALVLHLEHDRDDLGARLVRVTEDVVALAAAARVVVLLEVGPRETPWPGCG